MDDIITINLFGQEYSFRAESGVSDADGVADLLSREVGEIEEQFDKSSLPMNKVTILALAALNISCEYIELRKKHESLINNLEKRTYSISEMIEHRFNGL